VKNATPDAFGRHIPEERSTMFNHEELVGVKWM